MNDHYQNLQPGLFDFSDTAEGAIELFPEVWKALELVVSPVLENRVEGLNQLIDMDAQKVSPFVAYVLATCLDDEDIEFRLKVVQTVGALLTQSDIGFVTPLDVKKQLKFYLSKMRQRRIFALLQVAEYHPSAQVSVAALLKACSYAGRVLGDIFSDRRLPFEIRKQAIIFSGQVGFLETAPRLEKLAEKLISRRNGQRTMPFAPSIDEGLDLLPVINEALSLLNTP